MRTALTPDSYELRRYDNRGALENPNGKGKLESVQYGHPDHGNVANYRYAIKYDHLGRVDRSSECIAPVGINTCTTFATNFEYDEYSRLDRTVLPGGRLWVGRNHKNNIL